MEVILILFGIGLLWIAIGSLATSSGGLVGFICLMLGVGCFVNAFKSMLEGKKKR